MGHRLKAFPAEIATKSMPRYRQLTNQLSNLNLLNTLEGFRHIASTLFMQAMTAIIEIID